MFKIVDDRSVREDLKYRTETKYALPLADADGILKLLNQNCRRITHGDTAHSVVRSIYFDNCRMRSCEENLDGIANRQKIRLRWYDQKLPPKEFFFEIKWRRNRLMGKHRLGIVSDNALSIMPYRSIVAGLADVLPEGLRERLILNDEPKVLVEYKRQHFVAPDSDIRITLDRDLVFYDQTGRQKPAVKFGVPMPGFVVLEVKRPLSGPGSTSLQRELRGLLYPLRPRATRCSKYVHGCRLLGLASAAATAFT